MANKIKGITIEIGGDTQKLTKALEGVNKQSRDLQGELRQVERLLKLDPKNTELLVQKQKLLGDAISNTRDKLETLKEAERQVQQQFERGEIGEEQYRAIQREVIKTEQNLEKLERQLKETNNSWKDVADNLDKFGKKSTEIGKDLSKKVTAPIVGTGAAALKMGSDFTDALAKVSTLADTTQVSMDDLKLGILDISNATGIAASEISGSVYDALSAGVDTADVLDYVQSNVMLVKAGFTDMGTAIDATSTILNAYGEKAYDVSKIGDILVKTQDEGKISVDELGKNLGRVIPTASSLGINMDQLGASYAIMTAKGQNASIATTNLNSMLGELGKTGSKSDKALREMTGKSFKELINEGSSVGDVLGLLDEHAQNTGLSLADMFGSTTAGSAALTLLSDGVDEFNNKVDIMNNSTGTMAENFEKLKTPSEEMRVAINKIKNVMIELGEIILPVLSTFAEQISKVAEKFAGLDDSTKKIIVVIAGLVAAIGPLLIVIGQISLGLSSIIGLFGGATAATGGLSAALGALAGPVGIAIAAIAAIIVILIHFWNTNEEFRENVKQIWNQIKELFSVVMNAIRDTVTTIYNAIKEFWEQNSEQIKGITDAVWNTIAGIFNAVTEIIQGILDVFIGLFTGDWERFGQGLTTIWEGLWAGIQAIIDGAKAIIENIVQMFINFVSSKWEGFGAFLQNIWDTVWGTIQTVIDSVTQIIRGIFDVFVGLFTGDWERMSDGLKSIWEGLWDGIKAIVEGAWELLSGAFSGLWDSISDWFEDLIDDAFDWGKNLIDGFIDGIKSMIRKVKETVSNVVDTVSDFLGFHSPAKKGEGRYIVDWGYNMIDGFIEGMGKALPELQQVMNYVIPAINTTNITNNNISNNIDLKSVTKPINLVLDGKIVGRVLAPIINQEINVDMTKDLLGRGAY